MHLCKMLVKHKLTGVAKCYNNRFSLLQPYFLVIRLIFICVGVLKNNIFVIGLKQILKNCMNVYYTALKLLSGVQIGVCIFN